MLIEIQIPSLRLALQHGLGDSASLMERLLLLERLDENRRKVLYNNEFIQARRKLRRDKLGKLTEFEPGSLVILVDSWLMKQHGQKFQPKWKGPYVIHEKFDNRSYTLSSPDGSKITKPYNGSKLKPYYYSEHLQDPVDRVDQEPGEEMFQLIFPNVT